MLLPSFPPGTDSSSQRDSQLISRAFRLQKWECYEAKSLSGLNSYYLNHTSGIDLDVVLIDKEFQLFGEEDHVSIVSRLRSVHENLCVVGLVNNKREVREDDGYDLIVSRPLTDGDLLRIFNGCDVITIRSLLWLK
jgi:hypothetical protein